MAKGFRPLHDRVLVRRVEAEEKTAGGIIIPDTAQEKPQEGEVVAVGLAVVAALMIARWTMRVRLGLGPPQPVH